MDQNRPQLDFVNCQMCSTTPNEKCRFCLGNDFYGKIGGYALYWGETENLNFTYSVRYYQLKKIILQSLLIINALLLFGSFVYSIIINLSQQKSVLNIILDSSPLSLLFWILLGLLFISWYFVSGQKPVTKPLANFGFAPQTDNLLQKINITSSFKPAILADIHQTILNCEESKIKPNIWSLFDQMLNTNEFVWLFIKMEADPRSLRQALTLYLDNLKNEDQNLLHQQFDQVLIQAYAEAVNLKSNSVSYNHVLLALFHLCQPVSQVFEVLNVAAEQVEKVCLWQENINHQSDKLAEYRQKSRFKPAGHMNKAWTAVPTPILDAFGSDLTALAKYEYLDRLIKREKELDQTINILQKTSQNNILLVGETGVGKSAIINGLAYKMVAEDVPDRLKDKRLISLNLSQLISATTGYTERYFNEALNEIVKSGNIILFIEDLHLLAGVRSSSGGPLDLLAILTEVLGKNRIQFIASTTPESYSKYISTYDQLVAEVTKLDIGEIDNETACAIIESIAYKIENSEGILLTHPAVVSAVELSNDLIADKKLPAKAYDLLQEAAVISRNQKKFVVAKQDIIILLQQKTNIPLTQVSGEESAALLNLEQDLHGRVIGQEYAVKQVAEAVKRARVGLKDKNKPVASFLFVGPTGVGKTELAKALAAIYYGNEDKMIRLDMSEYQEIGDIKKIIGAPAGSSEFTERGYLTESVKKAPFSLVLLDELEKAHPDILNLFLQVLDEGKIKDSLGREVKFNNNIIIATSNAGTSLIQQGIKDNLPVNEIETNLMSELKKYYRPEFLNRFDGVIMFKPLQENEILQIAAIMIERINKNLATQKITVSVAEEALKQFISAGYNQEFGARGLYRTLQDKVKNVVAEKMLTGELKEGMKIEIIGEGEARIITNDEKVK